MRYAIMSLIGVWLVSGCVVRPGAHPPTRVTSDVHLHSAGSSASVSIVFSDRDRVLIQDYYRVHTPPGLAKKGKTPPGLAKKGKTPPGHVKRLERNQVLERHRTWQPLPADLLPRLAPLPTGYLHVRIDDAIAILDMQTRLVLDVLHPF